MPSAGAGVPTLTGRRARFQGGLRELRTGTYAWLQPNGAWGEANAGLVVGAGASLLVDTLWDQRLAHAMLEAMAPQLEAAPLSLVVNTHSDGDHFWGNNAVPAAAEIITSRASREAMDSESSPVELARLGALARWLRRAPRSLGLLGRYIDDMLSPFHFADVRLRHPGRTFEDRLTLNAGGRAVELLMLGPAHTPGDTVAYVPDAGVVFAADLLFVGSLPVMWHGPSTNWVAALDTLLGLEADVYVPGHGDVGGRAEVEAVRRFWVWLRTAAAEQFAAGRDLLSAGEALTGSAEFAEFRGWECPERLLISLAAIGRELAGEPPMKVTPPVRARLFRQVAILRERIAARELG